LRLGFPPAGPGASRTDSSSSLVGWEADCSIYGGLLVTIGALVLTGILQPEGPVDRRALTWHVLLWDLWFLLWGLALATTTWRSNRSGRLVA